MFQYQRGVTVNYIEKVVLPILKGSITTLELFFIVIILSIPLGFLITLLTKSPIKPINYFIKGYVLLMRGTPLLLQLLFIYFALPMLPVVGPFLKMERFTAACVGFVLNYAAYFSEIFRGGLLAVNKGQYESAKVLGLGRVHTMIHVVIPQMIRVALPSLINETITLVKDTALLYAVAVPELLHAAKTAVNRDFDASPFLVAAVIYLGIISIVTLLSRKVEQQFRFGEETV